MTDSRNRQKKIWRNRHTQRNKTVVQRFWEKVDQSGDCWEWLGGRYGNGDYGGFWLDGRTICAHRAALIVSGVEIPDGLWVLHKCDNPVCVNPDHLYLGTHQDNVDDKVSRGRQHRPKGELQGNSKLTEQDIIAIREAKKSGVRVKQIMRDWNISQAHTYRIIKAERWAHVS